MPPTLTEVRRACPDMHSPRRCVADHTSLDEFDGVTAAMLRSGETIALELTGFQVSLPPSCSGHETWFAVRAEGIVRYHGGPARWAQLLMAAKNLDELADLVDCAAHSRSGA